MTTQSTNFNKPESHNNFDVRCGETITMRLNVNHWEMSYCEYTEIDEIEYLGKGETVWDEINKRAALLYEKLWQTKWERTEAVIAEMEIVFDLYDVCEVKFENEESSSEDEIKSDEE